MRPADLSPTRGTGIATAPRNSPGGRRAPSRDRRRGICSRLIELSDLPQDFCLDARTLVDADVRDGLIASQVEIYDLAVETAVRSDRLAPPWSLVIVDRIENVGRDRILEKRRERHKEVNSDMLRFEQTGHVDDVVRAL